MRFLVVGGTGPTGVPLVNRLRAAGHEVTIFHSGAHPADFDGPVERIFGNARDAEDIAAKLADRSWDVTVCMYGRLRSLAEHLKGRTSRLVGITGQPVYKGAMPPTPEGRIPLPIPEFAERQYDAQNYTGKVAAGEDQLFAHHGRGDFEVVILRYPGVFGPRAPLNHEWAVVKRILDERPFMLMPHDGIAYFQRGYVDNLAHLAFLAATRPEAAGEAFNAGDERVLSSRHVAEIICDELGSAMELIGVPAQFCRGFFPLAEKSNQILDMSKARALLGYRDVVDVEAATRLTARHLADHPPSPEDLYPAGPGTFDYPREDAILAAWRDASALLKDVLGEAIRELADTSELVIDEFVKVQEISEQAVRSLREAEARHRELEGTIDTEAWDTPQAYVESLNAIRHHRGHLISLKEQRYIDQEALARLDEEAAELYDTVSASTAAFLARDDAMAPYHANIEQKAADVEQAEQVVALAPLVESLDETAAGIDMIMEIMNSLAIEDTNQRTTILDEVTSVYSRLNQVRAMARNRLRSLSSGEAEAEFGAQFRRFSQSIGNAISLVDTPEAADEQLTRLLVQLEELESKFSDYDQFLNDILSKREELYETFEERKQSLLEERQRRAHNLATAADRILAGLERRGATFGEADELNAFYSSDPMVLKVRELGEELRALDDQVRADDIDARLKAAREQAVRGLRDRLDIFEDGGATIKFGQHRFSVNNQSLDLTLLNQGDNLVFHLIGTDFYEGTSTPELEALRHTWDQALPSETANVYRAEYLAAEVLAAGEFSADLSDLDAVVARSAAARYQEGYERGVHDHDAALILRALFEVRERAGLLRFGPHIRALGLLFWALNPHNDVRRELWCTHAGSAHRLRDSLGSDEAFQTLANELERELVAFVSAHGLTQFEDDAVRACSEYLSLQLATPHQLFVVSQTGRDLAERVSSHLDELGHLGEFRAAIEEYGRISVTTRELDAPGNRRSGLGDQWGLAMAWLSAMARDGDDAARHFLPEACALLICGQNVSVEAADVDLAVEVGGLLGEHERVRDGKLALVLDEFEDRLREFRQSRVPEYHRFQTEKQAVLESGRERLRLEDFKPRPLASFVRNKLIDEVYLPIIGDNLAKQMGTVGDSKRTDLMGLLLLISPPGYGKTTLMEYVAERLGLVFMKINCPSLGHDVTSIDPATAPNSAAAQEIEKINLAFEMGNNVMLYLDDIQHTHPEFLQKYISLCDGTRRIDGVWQGEARTYDLRGKKFCVVMAGNPYTESGEVFKIPDMLANRADIYNLGDVLGGRERQFALSFVANALTSNPVLAPLALRDMEDVYKLVGMVEGGESTRLSHECSGAELNEMKGVLDRMMRVRDVVLRVNQAYIDSAAQADEYRTEPPFKLQGSYRNMNKMAEKISAVMNDAEVLELIDDHYRGEAQTLTSGTEQNLLKLAELRGAMNEAEASRWEEIKRGFTRVQSLGGDDEDPTTRVVNQISQVAASLGGIGERLDTFELDRIAGSFGEAIAAQRAPGSNQPDDAVSEGFRMTAKEIGKLSDALGSVDLSVQSPTDPQLVALVESLAKALEEKLELVIQSIENKNLIDIDIWERVKTVAADIERLKELRRDT